VHDDGDEFIGQEFQEKLQQHGIIDAPTTSQNPTGNAVCERMPQTVANVLETTLNITNPLRSHGDRKCNSIETGKQSSVDS